MSLHSLPFNRPRQGDFYSPIASLIQPPMDPTAVDFRAFYPYTPNEVKHRKRTTSAQLKVLEGIFKRDTKPNAALRNELAAQLDMTARGVQVWFQNRRAKEKAKAAKGKRSDQETSQGQEGGQDLSQESRDDQGDSSSQESSPTRVSPPQLHVNIDSATSSWNNSPAATPDDNSHVTAFNSDHHFLRRGSLPAGELFPTDSAISPPLIGHLDPFSRRRSVDASLHRLACNPYAHLARAKNGIPHGSRISRTRLPYHRPSCVPELQHTASMPYGTFHTRHSSMDSKPFRFPSNGINNPSSPSPLTHFTARASLPDSNLFSFPSRSVGSLIPGPLPSPDFTFGAASTTSSSLTSPISADSDRSSPEPPFADVGAFGTEYDKGSDHMLATYETYPRFGSVASTTTDSSYYSENSLSKPEDDAIDITRRDSISGQFVGMVANLDMNGYESSFAAAGGYSPPEEITSQSESTSAYPSPSATVSCNQPEVVPVSHSSELAFALQSQHTQMMKSSTPSYTPPSDENLDSAPFFYPTTGSYTLTSTPSFDSTEQQSSTSVDNYPAIYTPSGDLYHSEHQNPGQVLDSNLDFGHPQDVYTTYPVETPSAATYALSYSS